MKREEHLGVTVNSLILYHWNYKFSNTLPLLFKFIIAGCSRLFTQLCVLSTSICPLSLLTVFVWEPILKVLKAQGVNRCKTGKTMRYLDSWSDFKVDNLLVVMI